MGETIDLPVADVSFAARRARVSQYIACEAERRDKPRGVSRCDLVPRHVREYYDRFWAEQDRLDQMSSAYRPGLLRRLWRAIFS